MPAQHPALIIFDCDGVLIDSEAIACRVDSACFAAIGVDISADEIMQRYVGTSAATMFADIEARYRTTLPGTFGETLQQALAHAFETELVPMPGVAAVLTAHRGRVCVASSSTLARLHHSLSVAGLLDLVAPHVFSAEQVARGKPAPDLFLFAAGRIGVSPVNCVVIEDSLAGVQAGVAAGMRVYGFTGGSHCRAGHAERLLEAGAAAVFDQMATLQDSLADMLANVLAAGGKSHIPGPMSA